jgi:glycosyltransferase involved in cell wall biosynthesis
MSDITVAIPVRDGGDALARALAATVRQTTAHELLVCDSGSRDDSVDLARSYGARVIEIPPSQFSHGGTRNLLMAQASGTRVAFLTQDAEPADDRWLERLLGGFELGEDVAIVYGPYLPRPDAAPAVRWELERWFAGLARDGGPRIDRLEESELPSPTNERMLLAEALVGARGFFTDVNACIARGAWERVPFREVAYAEDRLLAIDMLRGGYEKVFIPDAPVWHSHDYTTLEQLRRSFDEWRGLREVYGWREPASPGHLTRQLRGALGQAREELARERASGRWRTLAEVSRHHLARLTGALLGSRAELLPAGVRRRLSLEGRASFSPLELDAPPPSSAIQGPMQ